MRIVPPTPERIAEAAAALRRGDLVGMPTETVYGIAAMATDAAAVRKTFALKRRPADNPLIVHLADVAELPSVAAEIPPLAQTLAEKFWPGPLTLVLPKRPRVPAEVTAGLDTVAVRVPAHPIARRLIAAAGMPLSAPSANAFMSLSPTRPEHIAPEIAEGLDLILDGGPCEIGLESTVVDVHEGRPRILRPGGITRADLEAALGVSIASAETGGPRRSPGLHARHYAPHTPLRLTDRLAPDEPGITFGVPAGPHQVRLPHDPRAFSEALYATLHNLDLLAAPEIFVERPPDSPEWEAVWDRLRRAAFS